MASSSQKRVIQLTGFKKEEKKALLKWLFKLDCVFLDCKKYRNCTHLIAKKLCRSEKFSAACAAGKWILTKEYIINSAESGRWLDETTYEWGYEIEKDTHYSPQMQSAPKRWREELTCSSAPGAFHRWKVVLPVKEGDKRMASIRRVLQAGKATICSSQNEECNITHIFINNNIFPMQNKKCLSEAPYYPLQYIGDYLFENEIQNTEDIQMNHFLAAQETDQNVSNMQLAEMKNAVIKHMYFAAAVKHRFAQKDQLNKCSLEVKCTDLSTGRWHILEGLVEEYLFPDVITELAAGQKYCKPPVQLLHSLLEYVLLENTNAILHAKLHHVLYLVLQHDPPWKSPSMLKYYLDLLQCPVCKKGTWSLLEMLVRSCLYCKNICHAVSVSGRGDEQRIVHKTLLKFFFELIKAEVEFLTKSLVEGTNSQHQQVMPQTVLLETFWLGSDTSVLFSKHIHILADWVILSHRELNRKNDAFRCEIAGLLNAILGTVVEYWVISSLLMDRNVFHEIAGDLAQYLAISCDDFSICELKMFICSIPSLWLQMFVAEAVFKKTCLQRNVPISTEPLSLQKIVCSYSQALQEVGMHATRKIHKAKKNKIGQWPCPESQKALQMLNGDKQNQVKVLPDLPDSKCLPLTTRLRAKAEVQAAHTKENGYLLAEEVHIYKRNSKGQTALHKACISNKVERLIQLLSSPGTDINAKDYAGWTPLHEACNHGSTVCVREILQRCPEVDLLSQVDGVTPLHDALSNGHVEIGKLLLQHGGPVLLQQRDSNGELPLDYVESVPVKQELLNVVHPEENIESFCERTEQDFCSQQRELWLFLFNKMLLNFCSVYNLSLPFTLTLRQVACSNVLQVMARGNCEMKNTFSADWLVDTYFRERETFQKLPQFLQEISASMVFYPGEQMKALLATLETMVEAYQLST
ncbi:SMC5-SMC6 complex localization factor protein 1 isoform X1 [Aquila chrysaetos chrysaetos]|uniref:SMC5-SMC6 complex localization factor 1 n=2 Tax=Aquila chrysaetos chrysaetos TaxID=223781 RepID=A0A663F2K9_AQUCH|nr:SMC5-SMC6 complex localization factor protein 1 isoform X1 [Aquila chrysaetos chrysaetos]XP_029860774.1 SMC5-SMC6 complex localization factor protein 1 isoform X1 [Aquila chrysaetos chrysaetos]XP_029860775.1 SMC5-SMC6 complex localization factor protein 1 isoform X1 [Aquila chrysaetos chrysaetos]